VEISTSQKESRVQVTVFRISGNFNDSEPLASMAKKAHQEGSRYMLIDLTDVPYASSAGLRTLHEIYNMLRDPSETAETVSKGLRDGSYYSPHLKLLKPSKMVVEVLKMTGFDMFLEIHKDLDQAVASF
jgi:anti-anti-sigma regulatory factor